MSSILYYVADPMCSWCWGFKPVLDEVRTALPQGISLVYVMGGLAKDSDEPMPEETRQYVQMNWREVTEEAGATFNWDFWTNCQPRRSTYPACRAVLAASAQQENSVPEMFEAIQRAYYQEARNPSDNATLVALADEIGLDKRRFEYDLTSEVTESLLQDDFNLRRSLTVREFPSLVLKHDTTQTWIVKGYANLETTLSRLADALA
ncbi:MAG TPA: DsbA family protein [Candidatus Latescibacteria bacterium]|nr:DsbA family protein [Candidatus Latescibacterota bacterium]|tara:strand:- start:7904 stop:8521 length:618 start_codon:yes stop_codon:yes gene_type:complete